MADVIPFPHRRSPAEAAAHAGSRHPALRWTGPDGYAHRRSARHDHIAACGETDLSRGIATAAAALCDRCYNTP